MTRRRPPDDDLPEGPSRRRVFWTRLALVAAALVTAALVMLPVLFTSDDLKAVVGLMGALIVLVASGFEIGKTVAGHDAQTMRVRVSLQRARSEAATARQLADSSRAAADKAKRDHDHAFMEAWRLGASTTTALTESSQKELADSALEHQEAWVQLSARATVDEQLRVDADEAVAAWEAALNKAVNAGTLRSIVWAALLAGGAMALMPDLIDAVRLLGAPEPPCQCG